MLDQNWFNGLRQTLLAMRTDRKNGWPWFGADSGIQVPLTQAYLQSIAHDAELQLKLKKACNGFFACSVLSYQMPGYTVWRNVTRAIKEVLEDPDDLFADMTSIAEWEFVEMKTVLKLHRFDSAYRRLWRIAKRVVDHYDGNAFNIWKSGIGTEVAPKLKKLGVGFALTNQVMGSLYDLGFVDHPLNVKPDKHICRLLGRLFYAGPPVDPMTACQLTVSINPENPWDLDQPLVRLGKGICKLKNPLCSKCPIANYCKQNFQNIA